MAQVTAKVATMRKLRIVPLMVALTTSLMASACAQVGSDLTPGFLAAEAKSETPDNRSDLQKATEYWGKQFAKSPNDPDAALSYARNLKAMGRKKQALSVLQHALKTHSDKPDLASEYGRLALELGKLNVAAKALAHADIAGNPNWKTISARGALLARQGKYKEAIPEFERALALSEGNPSVLNNLGMAYVLSGDPSTAERYLRQALASDGTNAKVQKNLALALGLQGRYAESKQVGGLAQNRHSADSDTETLRQLVRLPAKSAPIAAPSVAVATAPTPANVTAPQLKTATLDDTHEKWDKLVAMAKSSPPVDLRGPSQ